MENLHYFDQLIELSNIVILDPQLFKKTIYGFIVSSKWK